MLMTRIFPAAVALILLIGSSLSARAESIAATFAPFQQLLEQHLLEQDLADDGLVSAFRYTAALEDARTAPLLQAQDQALADFDIAQLDSREKAIAFWVNAYNYFMLAYILQNPHKGELISSVHDYGNFLNPYRVFKRDEFTIGGKDYSLDEMEKGILLGEDFARRGWKDARVHFAVNCASVGCPPLRQTIYTAANVDALLAENTRRALNTPYHLQRDGETLRLTQLFEWYAQDYVDEAGSVRAFIAQHGDARAQAQLAATTRIRFISYDWSLNRPENFPEIAAGR